MGQHFAKSLHLPQRQSFLYKDNLTERLLHLLVLTMTRFWFNFFVQCHMTNSLLLAESLLNPVVRCTINNTMLTAYLFQQTFAQIFGMYNVADLYNVWRKMDA